MRDYLDWNATTPLRGEAIAAMREAMEISGNPSSVHAEGRAAKMALEKAREQVAALRLESVWGKGYVLDLQAG